MKQYLYMALCGVVVTLSLSACGGSSTSGTSASSNSSNNELVGNLPGIIADYNAQEAALQEEAKQCTDMDEAMKLGEKQEEAKAALKEKVIAAGEKLAGKKIPSKMSEGLFYTLFSEPVIKGVNKEMAESAAILDVTFTAAQKEALIIPRLGATDYQICYKFVDSKGTPIQTGILYPFEQNVQSVTIAAGQSYGKDFPLTITISKNPEKWADLAEIVFITYDEYTALVN